MDKFAEAILTIQFLFALVSVGIIIYFISKRIKEKRDETFEKRDN